MAAAPQQIINAGPIAMTPMDMIAMAVQNGSSIDQIDKLMDLAERLDKKQAEKAFNAAKAAFSAENIVITKDKENTQFKSMYTTIGNLVSTVRPFLGKHDLSAGWTIEQTNGIVVTCTLSHALGHSESVTIKLPIDNTGAKNEIQKIKSTITYARAATFEAVCGLASTDDSNLDDDGNGAGSATKDERNEMKGAARDMRQRATPANVAAQRQPAPIETPAPLLFDANTAADTGRDGFGVFWKALSGVKRNQLAAHLEALQARVDAADKKAAK